MQLGYDESQSMAMDQSMGMDSNMFMPQQPMRQPVSHHRPIALSSYYPVAYRSISCSTIFLTLTNRFQLDYHLYLTFRPTSRPQTPSTASSSPTTSGGRSKLGTRRLISPSGLRRAYPLSLGCITRSSSSKGRGDPVESMDIPHRSIVRSARWMETCTA
jgi:hypothetical protein